MSQEVNTHFKFGLSIEAKALEWWKSQFKVSLLAKNYRRKIGEIDLIFEELLPSGEIELVFVEVRARLPGSWMNGLESVDFRKQQKLSMIISQFLVSYRGPAQTIRLDVLWWDGRNFVHFPNVW